MQVGIDVTSALTQGGGIGRYTRELVHALAVASLDPSVHFSLFSARPPAEPPVPRPLPEIETVSYKPSRLSEKWLYRLWYRLKFQIPVQLFTGKLDLFHSPDFVLPPVAGGIPTLLTVHDLSFVHYPEVFTPQLVDYLNDVVPWSISRATHVLADSESTLKDLVSIWDIPEEKITVLYSGVAPRFKPITQEDRLIKMAETYKLGSAPYILSVGTIQPRKNYQMLIRAFAPIAKRYPHNLVIVGGNGWLFDDIMEEVATQGLQGRVIFPGFVDDEDLPAMYSAATLFAMPSLYEGFGLPVLEAMACGVPVIHADTSSLPEVGGGSTIQLPPDNPQAWSESIAWLLDDPVRRAQLVAAGFYRAKQFTWEKSARQLLRLYTRLSRGELR